MKIIFEKFSGHIHLSLLFVTLILQFNYIYSRSNNKKLRFDNIKEDTNRKLKLSASASLENENEDIGKKDADPEDSENFDFFKDDPFFTTFDKENSNKLKTKNLTITIPTLPSFNLSFIQNLTNFGNIFPTKTTVTTNTNGITSILDSLLSLIGFSQIQSSLYPIIMILVAMATGVFWCAVFIYLYSFFFTGGGVFGGNNRKQHIINKNDYDYGRLPGSSYPSSIYGYGRALMSKLDSSYVSDFILNAIDLLGDKYLG